MVYGSIKFIVSLIFAKQSSLSGGNGRYFANFTASQQRRALASTEIFSFGKLLSVNLINRSPVVLLSKFLFCLRARYRLKISQNLIWYNYIRRFVQVILFKFFQLLHGFFIGRKPGCKYCCGLLFSFFEVAYNKKRSDQ